MILGFSMKSKLDKSNILLEELFSLTFHAIIGMIINLRKIFEGYTKGMLVDIVIHCDYHQQPG